jgi:predicted 2-oxoglutarate/Fe(II)-dependent dioxygenase YbiX
MLQIDLLSRFGIFVLPEFLDEETCDRVMGEMLGRDGAKATVTLRQTDDELAERYRRTTIAEVSTATASMVEQRLISVRERLEERFSVELGGCEKPQFLLYRKGDYIRAHSDGDMGEDAPDWLRRRTVSVVVFLNDQAENDAPGTFSGGVLNFYGLFSQDPRGESVGLPVAAKAGLLVAFPADLVHAVTPVERGNRAAVVTWFTPAG